MFDARAKNGLTRAVPSPCPVGCSRFMIFSYFDWRMIVAHVGLAIASSQQEMVGLKTKKTLLATRELVFIGHFENKIS